jgi:dephospho-CoA kinase
MKIFVIAGPPGIGKSTNAKNFVPVKTPIIDQDLAGYQYKNKDLQIIQILLRLPRTKKLNNIFLLQKVLRSS